MSSFTTPLKYSYIRKEWRNIYSIDEPFQYYSGDKDNPDLVINVPIGFETDLASIPWPVSKIFKPDGKYAKAAVIHDYLLYLIKNDTPMVNRKTADSIFYEAMLVLKIPKYKAYIFYRSVRLYSVLYRKS
ncbi:MAG: phage tail protein [Hyphomicrobiales bacterium]|nr:MAG: phage tail protein [Hyphomicrobiales bacterium]